MFKIVFSYLLIELVIRFSKANTIVKQEEFVGLCSSGKCQNGATCVQLGKNLAICLCSSNFLGIYCDIPITTTRPTTLTSLALCTPGICQNSGSCAQINENLAICICPDGFSGLYCENGSSSSTISSTELSTHETSLSTSQNTFKLCDDQSICKNDGICIFYVSNRIIECICQEGYTGNLCDAKTQS